MNSGNPLKLQVMIPPQTVLNLLKIGISGEQDGPKHTSNTFAKIISKMWCLQASHKSSLPIFFSKLVQALFHCPVLPAVVLKLMASTLQSDPIHPAF